MLGWFRRHAKILMVVLGSAAMAIFGLGPVFDELSQRGAGRDSRESQVIATWSGGKVTRVDLDKWRRGHWQSQRFLRALRETAEAKKGDRIASLAAPIRMLEEENRNQASIDDQLISRFLLSERARAEGVVDSDEMVDDYILLSAGDVELSPRDLEDINRKANQNCSLQQVKEHLKFELLAAQMQQYASAGIPLVPNPTEAIELYSRSQEQVECEVLAIDVEKFIDQVGDDLSASELKKIYDEGKYDFPDPTGENPGFKVGPKLNVQYFKADYEIALTNEMNKLTDADVQREYDRLVAEKSPIVMEAIEPEDDSIELPMSGLKVDAPDAPDDTESTPEGSGAAPSGVAPPPSMEAPAAGTTLEAPATQATPAVDAPAIPLIEVPAEGGAVVPPTEGSFKVSTSKFRFVSTASTQEAPVVQGAVEALVPATPAAPVVEGSLGTTQTPAAGPVVDSNLGTAPVVESTPVQTGSVEAPVVTTQGTPAAMPTTTPAVTTPAVTTPAVTTPATTTPAATQSETTTPPASTPATLEVVQDDEEPLGGLGDMGSAGSGESSEEEDNLKAKPLVDVADAVKRSMCEVEARKTMEKSLTKASVIIRDHFNKVMRYEEVNNKKGDPPTPLDLKGMADKYGLVFVETGLVDDVKILEDPIGALGVPMEVEYAGRTQRTVVPVGQMLFNDFGGLRKFDQQTVNDMWGSQDSYLFWVDDKVDTNIPAFEDCKEEVKKFVKQKKAFELAMAQAEKEKKKVNEIRGKTLGEIFGERAIPTGTFTWFTNFGSARYGTPNGVTAAGEDFMKTAFSLARLEAGVAANASKDVIYVVQALEPSRATSEAGHDFLSNQYFKYKRIPNEAFQIGQRYTRDLSLDFNQELQDEMEFKFIDR